MFDDKFFNKIDPVGNSYARTMSDKLGGNTGGFRTVTMQTAEGKVTLQTKGSGRPQLTLEAAGGVDTVLVPSLVEVDLSGDKTQNDRLFYHDKNVDSSATEYRVWSSDGLLSMLVKPLRRIIFKTSGIKPARTFSVWLADDSVEEIAAPVLTADGLPAAVERIDTPRTFHDTVYAYDKGDGADHSSLLGLAFAIKRIKSLSFLFEGVPHTLNLIGFDSTGTPVVEAGTAACGNLIEKSFSARSYGPKLKSLKANPVTVKLAGEGGLIPFAVKSDVVNPLEFTHKLSDLSKFEAFGQPWHGYLEVDKLTNVGTLYNGIDKTEVLLKNVELPESAYLPHRRYDFGEGNTYETAIDGETLKLKKTVTMPAGCYSLNPNAQRIMMQELLYKDSNGVVTKLSADINSVGEKKKLTLVVRGRFDDFTKTTAEPSVTVATHQTTGDYYTPDGFSTVIYNSKDGKRALISIRHLGSGDALVTYWTVVFAGEFVAGENGEYVSGITANIVHEAMGGVGVLQQALYSLNNFEGGVYVQALPFWPGGSGQGGMFHLAYFDNETNQQYDYLYGNTGSITTDYDANTWTREYQSGSGEVTAKYILSPGIQYFEFNDITSEWVPISFGVIRTVVYHVNVYGSGPTSGPIVYPPGTILDYDIILGYTNTQTETVFFGKIKGIKNPSLDNGGVMVAERTYTQDTHNVNSAHGGVYNEINVYSGNVGQIQCGVYQSTLLGVKPFGGSLTQTDPGSDIRIREFTTQIIQQTGVVNNYGGYDSGPPVVLDGPPPFWTCDGVIGGNIPHPIPAGKWVAYNSIEKTFHLIDDSKYGLFL